MGIEIPKIEVRYEHLSVEGDVYVGSRALPTLLNVTLNTIEVGSCSFSFPAFQTIVLMICSSNIFFWANVFLMQRQRLYSGFCNTED